MTVSIQKRYDLQSQARAHSPPSTSSMSNRTTAQSEAQDSKSPHYPHDDDQTQLQQPSTWASATKYFTIPIPGPVKRLFDQVPIITYPSNELPKNQIAESKKSENLPNLYIFSTEEGAAAGRPSYNPGCLKWQVCSLFICPCDGE